jgi:glutamate-ammonia-ligase adenylyltransferase
MVAIPPNGCRMKQRIPFAAVLQRMRACSPFAARLLDADARLEEALQARLDHAWDAEEMRAFLARFSVTDEVALKHALRSLRKQVMLRVIARDLNGLADLGEVMETCTLLAEVAIAYALEHLEPWQRALYGDPVGERGDIQPFIVVGMGKLGGRELNVSSDIDLIFAYPEDGQTTGPHIISNHEYFSRLGRKLIAAIGEVTSDGFVFRVDMRLRPYGDSGPLVGSFAALEEYYQTQGREWERYAWIKGRVIIGPERELQDLLRPFVFRRYLDYGAFASMRDLKAQIRREVSRREMHDNIKLGPGGIREIEFIAQVFQLIRGGRERDLQIRPTLAVLALLRDKGLLPAQTVAELSEAYVFLRNLEHRIQYLQDAQSQTLPTDPENRARLAAAMDFSDWPALQAVLEMHRARVESHFRQVFEESGTDTEHPAATLWGGRLDEADALERLAAMGYRQPEATRERLRRMRAGSRYQQLPEQSRARFDVLMPRLIEAAGKLRNSDVALQRTLGLLEAICRRASYLALMAEYPRTLELVVQLCSASPWMSEYLARHPVLLDELLDTRTLHATPDFAMLEDELEKALAGCGADVEQQLDTLRHFKHAQTFRFAAQDLLGDLSPEILADYLSALADLILDAVIRHAWVGLRGRHRETPAFAIIGYGKLGGKELGYASDLDLVFLYDDSAPDAGEIYARFGQRINAWLTSMTPAGVLYETDLRLRPDGASGLLVSSVAAFEEYQRNKAWTWEHQALTRARFCAGDVRVGAAFERIRQEVLCRPRELSVLREEVTAMRRRMHEGHPNPSGLFDLKHDDGGIVDVEFIVQYLVLAHAHAHPELTENLGNIALLKRAGALGLVDLELAERVADAYRVYRRLQHECRLQGMEQARVDPLPHENRRAQVRALWRQVLG